MKNMALRVVGIIFLFLILLCIRSDASRIMLHVLASSDLCMLGLNNFSCLICMGLASEKTRPAHQKHNQQAKHILQPSVLVGARYLYLHICGWAVCFHLLVPTDVDFHVFRAIFQAGDRNSEISISPASRAQSTGWSCRDCTMGSRCCFTAWLLEVRVQEEVRMHREAAPGVTDVAS